MLRHVGSKDCLDHDLPDALEVLRFELCCPVSFLILVHKLKRGCYMMTFKDTCIVVTDCLQILHINQEDVGHSWMLVVMATSSDVGGNALKVVQFDRLSYMA